MTETPLFAYTLRLADNALILGHRMSEWVGHAPVLEEDLALGNLGARSDRAGALVLHLCRRDRRQGPRRGCAGLSARRRRLAQRAAGRTAERRFRRRPSMRHLLYAAFAHPYFEALSRSKDETLAAIAAKAVKEMAYHVRHTGEWTIRLGDGTDGKPSPHAERARRTLAVHRRIVRDRSGRARADRDRYRGRSGERARALVEARSTHVFDEATLTRPRDGYMQSGGRSGRHYRASRLYPAPSCNICSAPIPERSGDAPRRHARSMPREQVARAWTGRAKPWSIRKFRC